MIDLSYIFFLLLLILMFALGLLVPVVLVLSYSRLGAGLMLILGIFMIDALTMGDGRLSLGINLFYADIALGFIALIAGLRLVFASDFPKKNRAWLFFCTLICVSLLTGLISYGSTAGVQARPYFYFMVTGLYAMSFVMNNERLRLVFNALTGTACLLIGLAVYRWVVYYTPIHSLLPPGGVYNIDGPIRVIYSNQALVIAQVLVAGFFFATASRGFAVARFLSPVLLGVVLVLQHRSVWLAGLISVLVRLLLGRSKSGSPFGQLLIIAGIVAVTAVPLVFIEKLSDVTQQIGASTTSALEGEGTTGERLRSWNEIVRNWYGAGVRSIVIGQSFGTDNSRYVTDGRGATRKIDYMAHNLYVQTLFNTGLLGLLAFLAATWYVIGGLYRIFQDGRGGTEAEVLLVLIVMQLAYYVPYGTDYLQSFLFGIALAYVAGKNVSIRRAVDARPEHGLLA